MAYSKFLGKFGPEISASTDRGGFDLTFGFETSDRDGYVQKLYALKIYLPSGQNISNIIICTKNIFIGVNVR